MVKLLKLACRKVALVKQIERSRNRLYGMAYAWSHDQMLADDLVQETQIRALQKLDQLRDETAFDGWIYMILNNVWLAHLRKTRPSEDIEQLVVSGNDCPVHELLLIQIDQMVMAGMAKLPNAQRQVISLVDLDGLSYAEVMGVLQIPIGTVMSRLNRARSALSKSIKQSRIESKNNIHVAYSANKKNIDTNLRVVKR